MKILILNANSDKKINLLIKKRVKELSFGSKHKFYFDYLKKAPFSIQGSKDGTLAKKELINYFNNKNNQKYDQYVLCCFDDIAYDEIKKIVKKPIYTLCKSSLMYSRTFKGKTLILTINHKSIKVIKKLLFKYKYQKIKVKALNINIKDIYKKNFKKLLSQSIGKIIKKDPKIKNIILGSTGLTKFKNAIKKDYNINFIDGLECSLYFTGVKNEK